jgi:cold shock CspA family protein/ribosome-associated translation inhibitor RaiA
MDRPLEIAFHEVQSSASLEIAIRKHVQALERRFTHLIGCRVSVETPHRQHQTGNLWEVHIVLSVPGRDIAVTREPHRAKERYADPDVYTTLRDAFDVAERELLKFKTKLGADTATPDANAMLGQVALIEPGADHGFLLTNLGTQLYFHRDSVTEGSFANLKRGDRVHYLEEAGDAGPVASKVRVASPVPSAE